MKKIALVLFMISFLCLAAGNATAAGAFEGKWLLDPDKMAENNPEYEIIRENPEIWDQVKAEMGKGFIELDLARGQIVETFNGADSTPAKIKVLSETENVLRIQAAGDDDVIVFVLIEPDRLSMSLEENREEQVLYFKR